MSKALLVLAGLTTLAPIFAAFYHDEESGVGRLTLLVVAIFTNGWLSQFVERGAWGLLFVQIPLAVVASAPAVRKLANRRSEKPQAFDDE